MDPDFPDSRLDNWKGTVSQFQQGELASYLVRWNPDTLGKLHPAFAAYCEQEDIALDRMWLFEEDLEPDSKAPHGPIRQATIGGALVPC